MIVILLLFFKPSATLFALNTSGTSIKRPMILLSIVSIIDMLKFWFLTRIHYTCIQLWIDILERITTSCSCSHLLLKGWLSSEHDIFNTIHANESENFGFSLPYRLDTFKIRRYRKLCRFHTSPMWERWYVSIFLNVSCIHTNIHLICLLCIDVWKKEVWHGTFDLRASTSNSRYHGA